jgi:hypothetical protein
MDALKNLVSPLTGSTGPLQDTLVSNLQFLVATVVVASYIELTV